MKIALITLSCEGARVARALAAQLEGSEIYLHSAVKGFPKTRRFTRIADLTGKLFASHRGLIFIAPTGLVVRTIAPLLRNKLSDPAVVVADVGGRWAISLLSGHEGGANELAMTVANIIAAEPVVTTTTEAVKTVIVGIGCRRGTAASSIIAAVTEALARAKISLEQVRLLASADLKRDEAGLLEAAKLLNVPLRFVSSEEIRRSPRRFARSDFVRKKVNLPAVAEPAALLAGRRTQLLLPKQIIQGVTVALAVENSTSSA